MRGPGCEVPESANVPPTTIVQLSTLENLMLRKYFPDVSPVRRSNAGQRPDVHFDQQEKLRSERLQSEIQDVGQLQTPTGVQSLR